MKTTDGTRPTPNSVAPEWNGKLGIEQHWNRIEFDSESPNQRRGSEYRSAVFSVPGGPRSSITQTGGLNPPQDSVQTEIIQDDYLARQGQRQSAMVRDPIVRARSMGPAGVRRSPGRLRPIGNMLLRSNA